MAKPQPPLALIGDIGGTNARFALVANRASASLPTAPNGPRGSQARPRVAPLGAVAKGPDGPAGA